eukprot:Rhum_TRINITY_DN25383_c0_g1::Rhum_TRINITY_DN25383_c0_g1_i1::g.181966::m.181966
MLCALFTLGHRGKLVRRQRKEGVVERGPDGLELTRAACHVVLHVLRVQQEARRPVSGLRPGFPAEVGVADGDDGVAEGEDGPVEPEEVHQEPAETSFGCVCTHLEGRVVLQEGNDQKGDGVGAQTSCERLVHRPLLQEVLDQRHERKDDGEPVAVLHDHLRVHAAVGRVERDVDVDPGLFVGELYQRHLRLLDHLRIRLVAEALSLDVRRKLVHCCVQLLLALHLQRDGQVHVRRRKHQPRHQAAERHDPTAGEQHGRNVRDVHHNLLPHDFLLVRRPQVPDKVHGFVVEPDHPVVVGVPARAPHGHCVVADPSGAVVVGSVEGDHVTGAEGGGHRGLRRRRRRQLDERGGGRRRGHVGRLDKRRGPVLRPPLLQGRPHVVADERHLSGLRHVGLHEVVRLLGLKPSQHVLVDHLPPPLRSALHLLVARRVVAPVRRGAAAGLATALLRRAVGGGDGRIGRLPQGFQVIEYAKLLHDGFRGLRRRHDLSSHNHYSLHYLFRAHRRSNEVQIL